MPKSMRPTVLHDLRVINLFFKSPQKIYIMQNSTNHVSVELSEPGE